jgi:hypothetical protein
MVTASRAGNEATASVTCAYINFDGAQQSFAPSLYHLPSQGGLLTGTFVPDYPGAEQADAESNYP